jgi:hypothetical protein
MRLGPVWICFLYIDITLWYKIVSFNKQRASSVFECLKEKDGRWRHLLGWAGALCDYVLSGRMGEVCYIPQWDLVAFCSTPLHTTLPSFLMHSGLITPKLQFIISLGAMKQESVGCQRAEGGGVKRFVAGSRGQFWGNLWGLGWVGKWILGL